jgi:hypothetical protein
VWDIKVAAACGLRCVAVSTGGISRSELLEAGAAADYASPLQLVEGPTTVRSASSSRQPSAPDRPDGRRADAVTRLRVS